MKLSKSLKTILSIFFVIIIALSVALGRSRTITKAETIRLAETFVWENGYSDSVLNKNSKYFRFEFLDKKADILELAQLRFGQLESKAAQAIPSNDGWTIMFRWKNPRSIGFGRSVFVNSSGSLIYINHQDNF